MLMKVSFPAQKVDNNFETIIPSTRDAENRNKHITAPSKKVNTANKNNCTDAIVLEILTYCAMYQYQLGIVFRCNKQNAVV